MASAVDIFQIVQLKRVKSMIEATLKDVKQEQWLRSRYNPEVAKSILPKSWVENRDSRKLVWVTQEEVEIPLIDVTDSHLNNILAYAERRRQMREEYEEALSSAPAELFF